MKKYDTIFDIGNLVNERLEYLYHVKAEIGKAITQMPEGKLLALPCADKRNFRYYVRYDASEKIGTYLDKTQTSLKSLLAAKKYYLKLEKEINVEIKKLEKIKALNVSDSIVTTFAGLNNGLKTLIEPINIDNIAYIEEWNNEEYKGLGFDENDSSEYYSKKGERMRSKSELLIANALFGHDIPYKYEKPLYRENGKAIYPDFTVLNVKKRKEIYWEHLGKMSDVDYINHNLWKLWEYKKMGIVLGDNLVVTYENSYNPLGTKDIEQTISNYLV